MSCHEGAASIVPRLYMFYIHSIFSSSLQLCEVLVLWLFLFYKERSLKARTSIVPTRWQPLSQGLQCHSTGQWLILVHWTDRKLRLGEKAWLPSTVFNNQRMPGSALAWSWLSAPWNKDCVTLSPWGFTFAKMWLVTVRRGRLKWHRAWPGICVDFFSFLAVPRGLWDLSSLTRDWTQAPCSGNVES